MSNCKISLILGPAKSGKTRRALERYAEFLEGWRRPPVGPLGAWVAPTPSAISSVRDRLASTTGGAFLHLNVLTFAMLAEEILARAGTRIRSIGPLEQHRALEHVVGSLRDKDRLRYFTAVAHTPGFIRQAAATIADLKRRGVGPEDFRLAARTHRDRDMAAIYAVYEEHLAVHRLYDAEGRFEAACEVLSRDATRHTGPRLTPTNAARRCPVTASDFGLVVVDGFADFTSAQHEMLRLLADHCEELLITLPADQPGLGRGLLFDKPTRTREILERSFPQVLRETASETHFSPEGLQFVERNLFRDELRDSTSPPTDGLAIVAANSVQAEVREIARRVKQLILAGRAQPDDIAVVFPSLADLAPRVAEVFSDFGVPVAIDHREPISATPLVRCMTKLLRLVAEDWPFELLLDVIALASKTPPLSTGEGDLLAALERSIRRAQLPSGRALLLDQLRHWADVADFDELPRERQEIVRDAQAALPVLESLERLLSALPTRDSITNWLNHVEQLARHLGVLNEPNAELWWLLRRNVVLISHVDTTFASEPSQLTVKQFLSSLESVTSQVPRPNPVETVGRVRVWAAESARNVSVKHVFLAGLGEQSYSSAESSRQLYGEQEIVRLMGDKCDNIGERQAGEAMLLFYDMITRASETLTLSYTAVDDRGQALPPSPYLTEVERCVAPNVIPTYTMPAGEILATSTEPLGHSDWRLAAVSSALEGDRKWLAGLSSGPATKLLGRAVLRGIDCVASRSASEVFGRFEGVLVGEDVRGFLARTFNAEHLWSPSQLELYAMCPYQFFAAQLLRLQPLQDIALRSDHLRRGNLLHQVLAVVYAERTDSPADARLVERFTTALEEAISRIPLHGLERALLEIERREILSWAPQFAEQESAYRSRWKSCDVSPVPTYFEVRFGPKARGEGTNDAVSTLVPFTLDLGGEQIKLTGQIDRIDMGQVDGVTVFNIIDYKSGQEIKLSDKEMLAGRQLQLPLYALAAERLLFADQKALALATGYWSIKSGGFPRNREAVLEFRTRGDEGLVESARWNALNGPITERVAEIIRAIRKGEFPVYNDNLKCTQYCDYSKICRIAQIRSLEKTWIPPQTNQSEKQSSSRRGSETAERGGSSKMQNDL